ncbi:MAG: hypothetical protein E7089_06700 [Bacteroidales bacterium]|nr:hypothetical protein [Bacteroidales bacterium]
MKYQNEIIEQLKVLANNVFFFTGVGWWYFKYGDYQMVFIPTNDSSNTIRICIPHFDSVEQHELESLTAAINETNREVKYVKIIVLGNGSISINYDHKYDGESDLYSILLHMLKTLCFTAEYLKKKFSEK